MLADWGPMSRDKVGSKQMIGLEASHGSTVRLRSTRTVQPVPLPTACTEGDRLRLLSMMLTTARCSVLTDAEGQFIAKKIVRVQFRTACNQLFIFWPLIEAATCLDLGPFISRTTPTKFNIAATVCRYLLSPQPVHLSMLRALDGALCCTVRSACEKAATKNKLWPKACHLPSLTIALS